MTDLTDSRTRTSNAPALPPVVPGLAVAVGLGVAARYLASHVDWLSGLVVAVVLGMALANLGGDRPALAPGLQFASRQLLRAGVVLLGLRLSLGDVGDLGGPTLALVVVVVLVTFFGTQLLGRWMGVSETQSVLIGSGFAICGASAVAAVQESVRGSREEVAGAIGLVTLCGSLSIFLLPAVASVVGLDGADFGVWVGASVHDVAQVVATASTGGSAALATATVVKLSRVVLLAAVLTWVGVRYRSADAAEGTRRRRTLVPPFVLAFLGMVVLRSSGVLPAQVIDWGGTAESWLLASALVGLGSGVRVQDLRKLGGPTLLLGLASWVLVAGVAYVGVRLTA